MAKEFFEALIAEDYAKAGLLMEGMPAEKMKEMFGRFKFQRIVEVGKPVAGSTPTRRHFKCRSRSNGTGDRPKKEAKRIHALCPTGVSDIRIDGGSAAGFDARIRLQRTNGRSESSPGNHDLPGLLVLSRAAGRMTGGR